MAQDAQKRTYDVFISHCPEDGGASDNGKPSAYGICRHLEAAGIKCWIAPRDVTPGLDRDEQTSMGVEQSRIVVLVVSPESLASKQVEDEFQMALKAAKTIIPVRTEDVELKGGFGGQLSLLRCLDALEPPFEDRATELVDRVRRCLEGSPTMELQVQLAVQPPEADSLYEEAAEWMRKAAEKGHSGAQANLGFCYEKGQGVAQDYEEAAEWYHMAAEQGNAWAQANLGYCYKQGQGVTQDYKEAVKWYRKAAEQGYAWAQVDLGFCYDQGQGVAQDFEEAVKWYRMAAEQGNVVAQFNLGLSYEQGRGLAQDYEEAANWFRKAAEQEDVEASYRLGLVLQQLAESRLVA